MKHPSLLQLLLTALVLFGLSSNKTSAQTASWIGGAGTDWNTAANWDTGVPTAGINAVIGSNVVVVYSSPMAASSFGSLFNAGNLTVSAGGFTIDANGATPLTVPLGSNSLITVTATGVFTITNSGAPSISATNSIAVEGGTFIVTNSTGGDFIIGASGNNGGVGFTNTWNTNNLAANGTITVTGLLPLPAFDSITISGNDIVATAINGAPNGPLIVITSTNVALPRVNWTPVLTNQFDGTGKFGFNEAIDPVAPQKFYSLEVR